METLTHTEEVQGLFVKHMGSIRGLIIGMVSDFSLAEDVLQEVFLVVTRKADDFEIGTNFMAWVRAVVRLKALEFVRQNRQLPFLLGEDALEAIASSAPVTDDGWVGRRDALVACLKVLPPRAGRIVSLRYEDGLLPPQIAELVKWSVGAVNVQLTKTRKLLRDCVRRKMAMEGA